MTAIKPRTTEVVLFQGDDLARIDELLEAVSSAIMQGPAPVRAASMGGSDEPADDEPVTPAQIAAKAHDDFVTEASERAEKVVLRALPRKKFRSLVEKHPPRDGNEADAKWGLNTDTLGDDLLPYVDDEDAEIRTVLSPEFANKAAVERFLDDLSDGDFSKIYMAALVLNRGSGDVPKADLSSRLARTSGATSKSLEG